MDNYDDRDGRSAVFFVWTLVVIQAFAMAAAAVLPFGFDKRSWLGLDFEHLMLLAALYVFACLLGIVFAAALRQWKLLLVQLGGAMMVLLALCLMSIGLIGDQNQTNLLPGEVEEFPSPVDGNERSAESEEVEKAIEDAARELAEPPIP